ncbi:MAG: acyl-CoA/acyl-ACP dehydrogenase [bacterium]|nr:acyl-CoA/acyl-ACP dehydrogenase [bacterium]
MKFAFSPEQEELRRFVRQFLEEKSPESAVRVQMDTEVGYDEAVWQQMVTQLGLAGLIIPEEYGGSGFGYVELIVVLEEMGRALLCAPFFSTVVLAANTLVAAGDEAACGQLLPQIASGETTACLAFTERSGRWDEAGITVEATADVAGADVGAATQDASASAATGTAGTVAAGSWRISGTKTFVIDGHTADVVLVAARTPQGVSLFWCPGDAEGLTRTALSTMDQTRKQARLDFANTPVNLVGELGAGWDVLERVLDLAAVALAAEQVGGAQMCLDTAVQYAKDRVQFGRPIGSFQAVKHICANMFLELESARSAAYYAAWCAADNSEELPVVASLAKAYCSEAYFKITADNVQVHGGIGFTWEHPAHLYFRRAKSSELLFGDPAYHRELLAQRIGI